ncbi:hypothetical protein CAEBREN_24470 [Caenorhabditis brenneri]|uniref:SCP domain-containing protein n=1 Tax=Caenorhabditis brenneri TaxID=135651 RepID=G0NES9_CAEBE|nr:hypothetical protein CAEBREN_24470 [Caenorhabditis brenneri]
MKFSIFCCTVLLSSLLQGIFGFAIREKRQYQLNQKEFVDNLNTVRRTLAKAGNISNTWKLEWSQELVDKAYSLKDQHCLALTPAYNYRYFYHEGNRDAEEYERGWAAWFEKHAKDVEASTKAFDSLAGRTAYFFERINPLQSKIGCVPFPCQFDIEMKEHYPVFTYHLEYKYLCLVGPYGQFPRGEVVGEPGSRCGETSHNEDGLCVEN